MKKNMFGLKQKENNEVIHLYSILIEKYTKKNVINNEKIIKEIMKIKDNKKRAYMLWLHGNINFMIEILMNKGMSKETKTFLNKIGMIPKKKMVPNYDVGGTMETDDLEDFEW